MAEKSFLLEDRQGAMIDKLSDEDAGKLLKAIFHYRETGEVDDLPFGADIVFIPIQQTIDENEEKYREVCERRAEAGRQGGRPKKANASEEKQKKQMVSEESKKSKRFSEKAKKADSDSDTDTDIKEKVSPIGDTKKKDSKPVKHKHGDFKNVLLTDDEYAKLKDRYSDIDERIQRLSLYIEQVGKVYKSHNATIIAWANRDEKENKTRGKPENSRYRGNQSDEEIFSDDIYEVF